MTPPTVATPAPEGSAGGQRASPVARALAAVPPPGLLLVSIVSIQLGAAVAIHLFDAIGPVSTVFLRLGFSAVLLLVARRRAIRSVTRRDAAMLLLMGCVIGAMNLCF